jgi:hypothetical protein
MIFVLSNNYVNEKAQKFSAGYILSCYRGYLNHPNSLFVNAFLIYLYFRYGFLRMQSNISVELF